VFNYIRIAYDTKLKQIGVDPKLFKWSAIKESLSQTQYMDLRKTIFEYEATSTNNMLFISLNILKYNQEIISKVFILRKGQTQNSWVDYRLLAIIIMQYMILHLEKLLR
jgi:hypothetical protein